MAEGGMSEIEVSVTIRVESDRELAELNDLIATAIWDAMDQLVRDHVLQNVSHVDADTFKADMSA
jgi:hypothetical protein